LRAHGLILMVVRELTMLAPYGADGDEGNGVFDADLREKLTRLPHPYVSIHSGTFDGPEKMSLRMTLSTTGWIRARPGESQLGLSADELQVPENALA